MKKLNSINNYFSKTSSPTARAITKNYKIEIKIIDHKEDNKTSNKNFILLKANKDFDIDTFRGKIDFVCFRENYPLNNFFHKNKPKLKKNEKIYNLIHSAKSQLKGLYYFPGSLKNVRRYVDYHEDDIDFDLDEIIVFYLFLIDSLSEKKIFKKKKDVYINDDEMKLINLLKKNLYNDEKFSFYANKLCNILDLNKKEQNNDSNKSLKEKKLQKSKEKNNRPENLANNKQEKEEKKLLKQLISQSLNEKLDLKNDNKNNSKGSKLKKIIPYEVFTKKFDLITNARNLAFGSELNTLRKKLDDESPKFTHLVNKLSKKLERKLVAFQERFWNFDLEEGLLDCSKLTRIIYNPASSLSFKKESKSKFKNTTVTLLIDNSGSMRGRPIMVAANAVEIITKTLEKCGVKIEVLGFTTREWKGGNSKNDWINNGKPTKPGRLNDLLHIIYKDSERSWKSCYKNLGLLLKDGLLKENIDGEAIIWAYKRLISKDEKRKILIVISDGAPVDDSTLSANSSNILEGHLSNVVEYVEKAGKIELLAIGIGHDVSKYYSKAFTIENVDKLAETMLEKLTELFTKKN